MTKIILIRRCVMCLVALMLCTNIAWGYLVGAAANLENLTEEADIIFKGTAVSAETVEDEWFKPYRGFVTRETQFKVVSVIKGETPTDKLAFRHYDTNPQDRVVIMFQPQLYRFEVDKTYIVFAKKTEVAGVFRQLWANHRMKFDQGVLLCADSKPVTEKTVKKILISELMAMLASAETGDVVYAIGQLDQMSGGGFGASSDFNREGVLAAVRKLITRDEPEIAQAAIALVGSHNNIKNIGGELYWRDLVAVADSNALTETRAMAIGALQLVREPQLKESIERWLADPSPKVRASATLLLANSPRQEAYAHLTTLADDPAPEVRVCVASAVGSGQMIGLTDVLEKLLSDQAPEVRQSAARNLLSFSPKNETVKRVFKENIGNEEFAPLFLLSLARENPANYLDALSKVVVEKNEPKNFWGGQIPAFTAWNILFKYLQSRPAGEIRGGRFDRYLDAMEKVGNYSSSEPRDIYAFYLQRGMTERAKAFREEAKKSVSYDLDYYFNMVDENPSLYTRE